MLWSPHLLQAPADGFHPIDPPQLPVQQQASGPDPVEVVDEVTAPPSPPVKTPPQVPPPAKARQNQHPPQQPTAVKSPGMVSAAALGSSAAFQSQSGASGAGASAGLGATPSIRSRQCHHPWKKSRLPVMDFSGHHSHCHHHHRQSHHRQRHRRQHIPQAISQLCGIFLCKGDGARQIDVLHHRPCIKWCRQRKNPVMLPGWIQHEWLFPITAVQLRREILSDYVIPIEIQREFFQLAALDGGFRRQVQILHFGCVKSPFTCPLNMTSCRKVTATVQEESPVRQLDGVCSAKLAGISCVTLLMWLSQWKEGSESQMEPRQKNVAVAVLALGRWGGWCGGGMEPGPRR